MRCGNKLFTFGMAPGLRSMSGLLAALALMLSLLAGRALAVEEPDGYRMGDYDAPVPETLTGAHVVGDEAAYALWLTGRVAVIDVMPDFPRPKNLPKDMIWRGRARHSIPGAIWLTEIGRGELSETGNLQFNQGLAFATEGDADAPMMFVCRADCWLSWNAARRAVKAGYTRVFWYPEGTTGWTFWEWPTERLKPWKPE